MAAGQRLEDFHSPLRAERRLRGLGARVVDGLAKAWAAIGAAGPFMAVSLGDAIGCCPEGMARRRLCRDRAVSRYETREWLALAFP